MLTLGLYCKIDTSAAIAATAASVAAANSYQHKFRQSQEDQVHGEATK